MECVLFGYLVFRTVCSGLPEIRRRNKRIEHHLRRQPTQKKANSGKGKPSEARECCLQQEKDTGNNGGRSLAGKAMTPMASKTTIVQYKPVTSLAGNNNVLADYK